MKTFTSTFRLCLILMAIIITSSAFAQNQVRIILHQPPPNQLSAGDLWKMTLENTTGSPIEIYLEGYGEEQTEGRIVDGTSPVFTLPAGRSNYNYESFKSGSVSWKNKNYEEFIVRTGTVPAGTYTTCVTAYSSEGMILGMEKCITQVISRGFEGEITLISPVDGENIDPSTPITFSWTPLPGGVPYKIKIVEIIGNQSPEEAIKRNKSFFEKDDIRLTMFQYPSSAPNFKDDRDYAWVVEANKILSQIWRIKPRPRKTSCKDFTVNIVPVNKETGETGDKEDNDKDKLEKRNRDAERDKEDKSDKEINRDECCFNISISNNYGGLESNNPVSFRIITDNTIISASGLGEGWNQSPSAIPPGTKTISWTRKSGSVPTGVLNLGNICFKEIKTDPFYITYEWLNKDKIVICKDSIKVSCRKDEIGCNQFGLRLFNNIANTFTTIKIIPVIPASITGVSIDNDDLHDWNLIAEPTGSYYDLNYINVSGFIPADPINLIDVNFIISVAPNVINPKMRIQWIDGNNLSVKEEEITLVGITAAQLADEDFIYDWTENTALIGSSTYPDNQLFAGAEAQQCQEPEIMEDERGCATISHSISCVGDQLTITLSCNTVPDATSYEWTVDGTAFPNGNTGFSTPLTGTDQTSATITLIVYGVDPETNGTIILCETSKTVGYCRPTAEFVSSTPVVACVNDVLKGWDVKFTPATACPGNSSIVWKFGDGSPDITQTTLGEVTHRFTAAGSYTVSLAFTDVNGCKVTKTNKVTITNDCKPKFHMTYEWCDTSINREKFYDILVTFTNQSVCFCNTTFTWDFGDGQTQTTNCNQNTITHTYHAQPNTTFSPKLTMTDKSACANGKSVTQPFVLKPVFNDLDVFPCPDGMVKFSTTSPGKKKWKITNWAALVSDPAYYCLPSPFDPFLNIQINAFLGALGTSIPQIWFNLWNYEKFQLRFKDGATITTSLTTVDEQEFVTGTCTITKTVTVNITCCIDDFNRVDYRYKSIGNKDYRMKVRFKTHYREAHAAPGPGACMDFYLSAFLDEKTHLIARTIFQRKRKVPVFGWTYYLPTRADYIKSGIEGTFLKKGGAKDCNCETQVPWNNSKTKTNAMWTTYRANTPELYKIDKASVIKSYHHIKKNGVTWDEEFIKHIGNCGPTGQ